MLEAQTESRRTNFHCRVSLRLVPSLDALVFFARGKVRCHRRNEWAALGLPDPSPRIDQVILQPRSLATHQVKFCEAALTLQHRGDSIYSRGTTSTLQYSAAFTLSTSSSSVRYADFK